MTDPTPPDAKCRHCRESRSAHSGRLDICPGNSWASSFEPVVRNEKCRKCGKAAIEHPPYLKRRPHIVDGQFQSDKYPACPPGKVPLSVKDPTAQDLLWEYAQRRRLVDLEFADDLEFALRETGYEGWAALDRVSLSAVERKYVELGRELREVREQLDEARRNEVLRAQERDEAIASGKVLVEANLRHFNTATENHNRAEALWNELVEVAAQAKEWERRFNWKADASNTELAEMTKRAEAAEEADTDLLRRCEVGENQLAREQKRGQFDYEQAEKARGERDDARNEIASVTTERDALRLGQKVVAERQREACAKAIERNWANPILKVRRTPLVTDVPAAEREENVMAAADAESDAHQAKMAALSREDDAWWHPAVATTNEAIREENAELDEPDEDHICVRQDVRIRELESQLEGRKARIRELENLLKAIMVERDDAVEFSKSTMREGQARAITWAAKTMYDSAWSLQRGYHVKLSELADLVRSGSVTP